MNARLISIAPSAALAVTVIFSRWSGNDKSPFLVLLVLGLIALMLLVALSTVLMGGAGRARAQTLAFGALVPLLYAGIVIALSRRGWVDPEPFLGFR